MKKIFSIFVLSYLRFFAKLKLLIINPKIIGVTGSVGKSSTIAALHTIISKSFKTKTTFKGNSESGIPLEILNLKMKDYSFWSWFKVLILAPFKFLFDIQRYEVLIVEMGVDSPKPPKNMDYLLKIVNPDIGIVLNVEPVHTEQFGSVEKIANEKMKLVTSLSKNNVAIVNGDNHYMKQYFSQIKARLIFFGFEKNYQLSIINYQLENFHTEFEFAVDRKKYVLEFTNRIFTKEYGSVFSAAILAAKELGISVDESIFRLENDYVLPQGRLSVLKGKKNSTIIDSSYNSSPSALFALFNLVCEMDVKGKKIGILGDMRELGERTQKEHEKAGIEAAKVFDTIVLVGPFMRKYAYPPLLNSGFSKDKVFCFDKSCGVGDFVFKNILRDNDLVLVKGSQNTIFLEQAVYEMMEEKNMAKKLLCRQSEYWEEKRRSFFKNY